MTDTTAAKFDTYIGSRASRTATILTPPTTI